MRLLHLTLGTLQSHDSEELDLEFADTTIRKVLSDLDIRFEADTGNIEPTSAKRRKVSSIASSTCDPVKILSRMLRIPLEAPDDVILLESDIM